MAQSSLASSVRSQTPPAQAYARTQLQRRQRRSSEHGACARSRPDCRTIADTQLDLQRAKPRDMGGVLGVKPNPRKRHRRRSRNCLHLARKCKRRNVRRRNRECRGRRSVHNSGIKPHHDDSLSLTHFASNRTMLTHEEKTDTNHGWPAVTRTSEQAGCETPQRVYVGMVGCGRFGVRNQPGVGAHDGARPEQKRRDRPCARMNP